MTLRHPGSNIPGHVNPGNEQFRGTSPLAGHGTTISCWDCGKHRPQHLGSKQRRWGKWHWVCNDCIAAKAAKKESAS